MKNLELQNFGVAIISAREMRDTNGGCHDWFCYHHLVEFVDDFVRGFNEGTGAEC